MTRLTSEQAAARVRLLETFLEELVAWRQARAAQFEARRSYDSGASDDLGEKIEELESTLNRRVVPVRTAVSDAGIAITMSITAPAMLGGRITNDIDIFGMLLREVYQQPIWPFARQKAEQAIGFYEQVRDGTGLVHSDAPQALDLLSAIERALRPTFSSPPSDEKAVQDAVETIIRALGIEYSREKDRAAVGPTTFIPDFVLSALDVALEVKLATAKHADAAIQHEIAEDVAGYGTRWSRLMFVVYDCGAIKDPTQLRTANERHFGVHVLVIKH